jgi:nucleotide-binding universal stress UspA family protein
MEPCARDDVRATDRGATVVVGVDGSPASVSAVHRACEEARVRGGVVEVVTVWTYPPGATSEWLAYRAGRRWALRAQAAVVSRATGHLTQPPPITGVVVDGDPADVLARAGRGAACIVLGRHPETPLEASSGSTRERCMARAGCPVVVVPPPPVHHRLAPTLEPFRSGAA